MAADIEMELYPLNPLKVKGDENRMATTYSPPIHMAVKRHNRQSSSRRLVLKNGRCNIGSTNVAKMHSRYLVDIFTTLMDTRWRWTMLLCVTVFVSSWIVFAGVWWLITISHNDFESAQNNGKANQSIYIHKPCMNNVYSFTTALLFSIETQQTIGYGYRQMTDECPEAMIVVMIQSCFGVIIHALITGLVFAKVSRPKKRSETLMFSKNAVINREKGNLLVQFRIADMRDTHILGGKLRAILVRKDRDIRGGTIISQRDVDLTTSTGSKNIFLAWPLFIQHKIDCHSPFFVISEADISHTDFELIIIFEGVVASTGMPLQARTSYLPGEIIWGHRFQQLVIHQKENGVFQFDFSRFNNVERSPDFAVDDILSSNDSDT